MNTYKNQIPSAYKTKEKMNPIQEEIAKNVGTYNLTAIIEEDKDTALKLKNIPNSICFLCTLKIGNEIIGIGRGSANLNRMNRGIERGVRYSFGNAIIDAIVRGVKNLDVLAQYKGDKDHLPSFGDVPLNIQIAKRDQVVDDYKTVNNYVEKGSSKGAPKIIATSVDHVLDWKKDPTSVDSAIWGNAMCVMVGAKTLLSTEIQYKLPCIFYLSSDQQTKFDSLRQYEDDTFFKIIADKGSNVDLFDTYVSQWKTLGGDAILSSISNTVK